MHRRCWRVLARTRRADGSFSPACVLLNCSMAMGHNTAFTCSNGHTLVAFGNSLGFGGILRSELRLDARSVRVGRDGVAPEPSLMRRWSACVPIISSDAAISGCVEHRERFAGQCEYDGKLSVARLGARLFLYARANVNAPGGRHVLVSATRDLTGRRGWSRFLVVRFDGYRLEPDNNIYYLAAAAAGGGRLVGFFPGLVDGVAGVFSCTSTNGYAWSRPKLELPSRQVYDRWGGADERSRRSNGGRVSEQPVDGLLRPARIDGARTAASLLVMYSVQMGVEVEQQIRAGHVATAWARPHMRWSEAGVRRVGRSGDPGSGDASASGRPKYTAPFFCRRDVVLDT